MLKIIDFSHQSGHISAQHKARTLDKSSLKSSDSALSHGFKRGVGQKSTFERETFSCPNGHSTFNFVYQASKKAIMCICFSGSDLHVQYSDFEQDIHFFYTVCEFLVNTPLIYQNKVRLKKC